MAISRNKFLFILTGLFAVEWALLAISPHDRADWALENILVFVTVAVLALSYRTFPLSRISYGLIFIFLCLHEVGAHYTYAEVPYNDWTRSLFGTSLNDMLGLERNHFDRVIHFFYGLLLFYPVRELFVRIADAKGFWAYTLPVHIVMSTSMIFELFEWVVAEIFGGDLGMAYLGTQGDVWDAHKDMVLASFGAIIAMVIVVLINLGLKRDVAREWWESLSVKHPEPLGEEAINKPLPNV